MSGGRAAGARWRGGRSVGASASGMKGRPARASTGVFSVAASATRIKPVNPSRPCGAGGGEGKRETDETGRASAQSEERRMTASSRPTAGNGSPNRSRSNSTVSTNGRGYGRGSRDNRSSNACRSHASSREWRSLEATPSRRSTSIRSSSTGRPPSYKPSKSSARNFANRRFTSCAHASTEKASCAASGNGIAAGRSENIDALSIARAPEAYRRAWVGAEMAWSVGILRSMGSREVSREAPPGSRQKNHHERGVF